MMRAFSFPMSLERIRNKERLEASLAGLCELNFLKQRQEYLVYSALRIGLQGSKEADPRAQPDELSTRSQEDFTLRQQLNGLVSELEQQVGELHVHGSPLLTDPSSELGDSRPSSGFYELSESLSPIGQSDSSVFGDFPPGYSRMRGLAEARMNYANERPKSVGDLFLMDQECLGLHSDSSPISLVPRSFSSPYPNSLDGTAEGRYPWDSPYSFPGPSQMGSCYSEQPYQDSGEQPSAGDFQQAHRVESYILGLLQRRALPPRPSIPRTSLSSEPPKGLARQSSLCCRQAESGESRYTQGGSVNPSQGFEGKARPLWASQGMEQVESYQEEALSLLYQRQPIRPTSLEYRHQDQASLEPSLGAGSEPEYQEELEEQEYPQSPGSAFQYCEAYQEYRGQRSPLADEEMVSAQYIPAQQSSRSSGAHSYQRQLIKQASFGGRSRGESPRSPERFPFQHPSRAKTTPKKCRFTEDGGPRSGAKKSGKKACRSQSENSLMGQRGALERRYNTVEREEGYGRGAQQQQQQQQQQRPKRVSGSGGSSGSSGGGYRKWRSTLEISQDEDESHYQRRSRKQRLPLLPLPPPPSRPLYQADFGEPLSPPRAPVCLPEKDLRGYAVPSLGDSESSLSEEADSPGSSSLSSDSDESGGLVWPQQLPPKLGENPSSSSCSSPSSSTCTPAGAQPKAFVKIKASHALKKKILRFRTGSLKVMTTV
ncbi:dapper homolog 3-like [Polyodon spathula]|uniref:dapper homolog 3-like n=1 Tax=Polyodon spathula TaxID=7913 RepID=UPI001B7E9FC3|nr:dapper homolog 3-like [Polyodon spathula]